MVQKQVSAVKKNTLEEGPLKPDGQGRPFGGHFEQHAV